MVKSQCFNFRIMTQHPIPLFFFHGECINFKIPAVFIHLVNWTLNTSTGLPKYLDFVLHEGEPHKLLAALSACPSSLLCFVVVFSLPCDS